MRLPILFTSFHILSFYVLAIADGEPSNLLKDNSHNCSCYTIDSGGTPSYFRYHRFWDFRQLSSDYLDSDAWNADWSIQTWTLRASQNAPLRRINSVKNVEISTASGDGGNVTALALSTYRDADTQYTAEIENSQKNLMHGTFRMRARVIGSDEAQASKGACAGFFTFYNDDNEIDVEILTSDPTDVIRYTNQPALTPAGDPIPAAAVTASNLPAWNEYHTHRIDWLDRQTHWYLDDQLVASNSYNVPRQPSGLVLNMWGDGGEWTGEMSIGGFARLEIEWVEAVFNTSGPVYGPGSQGEKLADWNEQKRAAPCKVVCRIDGVAEVGFPEVVEAPVSSGWRRFGPPDGMSGLLGLIGLLYIALR